MKIALGLLLLLALPVQGEDVTASKKITLSQKIVAELVLKQSDHVEEANLTSDLARLGLSTVEKQFDWTLKAETGYEFAKPLEMNRYLNLKDETLKTNVSLSRLWRSGTTVTFDWTRNSLQSEFNPQSPTTFGVFPSRNNKDELSFAIEQSLWRNALGSSNRAQLQAAEEKLKSAREKRGSQLQRHVLDGLKKYWAAFVAQENFRAALRAREAYEKLVTTVKRKNAFGYTGGGELPQAQAEFTIRIQKAKTESMNYIKSIEELLHFLNLPPGSEVEFTVEQEIPEPPKLSEIQLTTLREYQAQESSLRAAQLEHRSSKGLNAPEVALVGKVTQVGVDPDPTTSLGGALSGNHPRYYVGVKLSHTFGSNAAAEDELNKSLSLRIEEIKTNRLKSNLAMQLSLQEKRVQTAFAVAQTSLEQRTLRAKALGEVNQFYNQGRTEIRNVTLSMNDAFDAEVNHSRAIGDYQIALAEWASLRDELIPSEKAEQGGSE